MASIIQIRRDTASDWTSANPTLAQGELALETDTLKLKAGDGTTAWTSLAYYTLGIAGFLPTTGGALTGALTTNSTIDGVDIATRDGVLTSTTSTANTANTTAAAALAKSGGAMTGAITTNSTFDGRDVATDGTKLDTIYPNIPQNSQSAPYTLVIGDSGKHILHPSADTTARVFTIPANASVAYTIGTAITFINENGAGVVTISITSDTMRIAGDGTTGNRTLAANGMATAVKVTATSWIIAGSGLE